MATITSITEAIAALKDMAEALPEAITIDNTLTQSGKAADAKAVGDKFANHTQAASTITAGTFAGAVVAQITSQTPSISLLRNSKIVSSETNPTYNGEICWTYE